MADWQIQEAKARFSELIETAQSQGPQTITKHGKARAVVLSPEAYEALRKKKQKPRRDFVDFLMNAGPIFEGVDLERSKDTGREIDLE